MFSIMDLEQFCSKQDFIWHVTIFVPNKIYKGLEQYLFIKRFSKTWNKVCSINKVFHHTNVFQQILSKIFKRVIAIVGPRGKPMYLAVKKSKL